MERPTLVRSDEEFQYDSERIFVDAGLLSVRLNLTGLRVQRPMQGNGSSGSPKAADDDSGKSILIGALHPLPEVGSLVRSHRKTRDAARRPAAEEVKALLDSIRAQLTDADQRDDGRLTKSYHGEILVTSRVEKRKSGLNHASQLLSLSAYERLTPVGTRRFPPFRGTVVGV